MRWITFFFFAIFSSCDQRPDLKRLQGSEDLYTWKEHEVFSFKMAKLDVCHSIPKYEMRFSGFPVLERIQCAYARSQCFQSVAQKILDPLQCENVHELRMPFLDGTGTSNEACLRLVEKAKMDFAEKKRLFRHLKITSMSAEIVGQKLHLSLQTSGDDLVEYELEVLLAVFGSKREEIHPEDTIFSQPLGYLKVPVDKIEVARSLHLKKGQYLNSVRARLIPKKDGVNPYSVRGCSLELKTKSFSCYY